MTSNSQSGPAPGEVKPQQWKAKKPARPTSQPEGAGSARAKLLIPLLAPLLFMLLTVPTGFLVESPGPSFDLQEDLTVKGAETYPSRGELLLTAVSLQESRLFYHLVALFDDSFDLIKATDYLGKELDTEGQDIVDIVITFLSQDTAVVAGLREVGVPVEVEGVGIFVAIVAPDYPAYGALDPGEVITSVNGEAVDSMERLSELVGSTPEGETVSLEVLGIDQEYATDVDQGVQEGTMQRPDLTRLLEDKPREVEIQPVYDAELGRSIIGISGREYFTYTSSVKAAWDLERVKGPSAGLMMTLSLVNALTPEDLTWGDRIAGTGEITLDGDVGPIGGLPFKIMAAEREGAEVFIYPVENQDDLEGLSINGMKLYAVDDLDDALEVLRSLE